MANNCYNYATFSGPKENLQRLHNALEVYESDCLFYESFYKILEQNLPEQFDVYEDFGTKWFEAYSDFNGETLSLSGDSAWSPPLEFFRKLCIKFKVSCESTYEEPGCDFGGYFDCDEEGNYNDNQMTYFEFELSEDRNRAIENVMENIRCCSYECFEEVLSKEEFMLLTEEEIEKLKKEYEQCTY